MKFAINLVLSILIILASIFFMTLAWKFDHWPKEWHTSVEEYSHLNLSKH